MTIPTAGHDRDRVLNGLLRREISQWRAIKMMQVGTPAQVEHALRDAIADILTLAAEIHKMRVRPTLHAHTEAVADAARRGYVYGQNDGYQAGAFDALCPAAPEHRRALSFGPK